jgi:hypothetical protein
MTFHPVKKSSPSINNDNMEQKFGVSESVCSSIIRDDVYPRLTQLIAREDSLLISMTPSSLMAYHLFILDKNLKF